MNNSNRALNRILLAIVGLAGLAASAAAVALLVVPGFAAGWMTAGREIVRTADTLFGTPLWAGTTVSLAAAIGLALALVFVLLLVAFVLRQGRGGTSTVLTLHGDDGSIEVDAAVPSALLDDRLSGVPGVAGVSVSAYRVRAQPVLKVTVRCRRGASARIVADALDDAVVRMQEALGAPVPVFAQLVGGFRARLAPAVRVDTSTSTVRSS